MTGPYRSARSADRGGFALVMVVFLLFAIAVAGATGFQVVSNEFTLATQNRDAQEALVIARAGLQRFLGETVGQVGDSVSYAIGNGVATVTTRKLVEKDSLNHLYYIRSKGAVADIRTPQNPAIRTVGAYAWHRLNPIPPKAAIMLTGGQLRLYNLGPPSEVSGADHASSGDCSFGGTVPTRGIATAGSIANYGGSYTGTPSASVGYSNFNAAYDTVGIRWDILKDPSFPVDFEDAMPNFGSLPSDSFPIIRYNGNLTAWGGQSGRGVLIVTGTLVILSDFEWDGIILAGDFYYSSGSTSYQPRVNGMLIGGLTTTRSYIYLLYGEFYYDSCKAYAANKSLSYLEVVDNTLFEING